MAYNYKEARRLFEAAKKDGANGVNKHLSEVTGAIRDGQFKTGDFSLRGLFEAYVEDGRELLEEMKPGHSGGFRVLENAVVNTAAFSNITGQIVYNAMLEGFTAPELTFSKLVETQSTDFNGEKIPGIGGVGDLAEVIPEGAEYPTVGLNEDWIETPQTEKRGFILPITKEAIFFDRTGLLLREARKLGEFLGINKEKRIIDAVIDENATRHRYKWRGTTYATFQSSAPWVNLQASNALVDWTDIDAAEQLFSNMVDPNTGEPIMITPKHLVVTRDLLYTARRIVNATEIRVATPGYATTGNPTETATSNPISGYSIVTSQLLKARMATDSSWFVGDVSKAVRYMENFPLSVVQAERNSEADFTKDIVFRYKASERGAAAVVEPRYLVKCTA